MVAYGQLYQPLTTICKFLRDKDFITERAQDPVKGFLLGNNSHV